MQQHAVPSGICVARDVSSRVPVCQQHLDQLRDFQPGQTRYRGIVAAQVRDRQPEARQHRLAPAEQPLHCMTLLNGFLLGKTLWETCFAEKLLLAENCFRIPCYIYTQRIP